MNRNTIDTYIEEHETSYQAKYCYLSCDWLGEGKYKFHYYIRDPQLMQINVFLNISVEENTVDVDVLEKLHDQEKNAIALDALKRIRYYFDRDKTLDYTMLSEFIKNPRNYDQLTSQDIIHIWNYICYHEGKNHDSVYHFYTIFLSYIKELLIRNDYFAIMVIINAIFDEILYEVTWVGINATYLDQEYMMHQAYLRTFFDIIDPVIEDIYSEVELLFTVMILRFIQYPKLGLAMYPVVENLIFNHRKIFESLLIHLTKLLKEKRYTLQGELIFGLMEAKYNKDNEKYYTTVISLLLQLVDEIVNIVNHEEQLQVGWMFIQREGYQILLDAFNQSCNSYIYQWFKISEIPREYHEEIRLSLEKAIQYYANILEKEPRNLNAFDQIANCNILLLESFK